MENISKKSEILFLYETSYNIPNGDPFTGEQRYDEETKKILVSDVRMKRYVRDYLSTKENVHIYIQKKDASTVTEETKEDENSNAENEDKKGSGSARRIDELIKHFKLELEAKQKELEAKVDETLKVPSKDIFGRQEESDTKKQKDKKAKVSFSQAEFVMKKCIDVRLFGGISTKKTDAINLTGPVQFALLNPSFNKIKFKIHQNTSVLESKQGNKQGAIATTTLVPYSLIQIHGWLNPKVAETTEMTEDDLKLMFEGLWYGTSGDGSSHSRSKVGQNSVLLLEIVYAQNNQKIYGVDRLIKLTPKDNKKGEELRSMDDYQLDFSKLIEVANSDKVDKIKFYTEIEAIKSELFNKNKFEQIEFEQKTDDQ
jgi:CRISPR-associated protein Csh2